MLAIFVHEVRQGMRTLAIWGIVIGATMMLCMLAFPEMEIQSAEFEEMFSSLGGFTAAFGMDQVSIADPLGFYGVQAGAVIGLGGALFAALVGIRMLSKEETDHTAEFLLTHPVSRPAVITGKLLAVIIQILLFNVVCLAFGIASFAIIDEPIPGKGLLLLHLAQLALQVEVACICFGASAFLRRGSVGFGLGLAALLYFMNIIANISEKADFLRFITPFGYADAANIIPDLAINGELLALGLAYAVVGVVTAYIIYPRKDIAV